MIGRVLLAYLLLGTLPAAAAPQFTQCTPAQQAALSAALTASADALSTAFRALASGRAQPYVRAWFGPQIASTPLALRRQLLALQAGQQETQDLQFDCSATTCTTDMLGYVARNSSIMVCPDFFSRPLRGVHDSQMGILLHELSHRALATKDHVYGTSPARALAAQQPQQAFENADNYQFFLEALADRLPGGDQPYSAANSCPWAFDLVCDERAQDGKKAPCRPGTDTYDCTHDTARTADLPQLQKQP